MSSIKLIQADGKIKVVSPYNKDFIQRARNLKGVWKNSAWIFNDTEAGYVRQALLDIYGTTGEDTYAECTLVVKNYSDRADKGPVVLFGRTIARAFGRDTGAKLGDDIIFISGEYKSCGSVKNWGTEVEDATFEIQHFPLAQAEKKEVQQAITAGWAEIKQQTKQRNKDEILTDIEKAEKKLAELKAELKNLEEE